MFFRSYPGPGWSREMGGGSPDKMGANADMTAQLRFAHTLTPTLYPLPPTPYTLHLYNLHTFTLHPTPCTPTTCNLHPALTTFTLPS